MNKGSKKSVNSKNKKRTEKVSEDSTEGGNNRDVNRKDSVKSQNAGGKEENEPESNTEIGTPEEKHKEEEKVVREEENVENKEDSGNSNEHTDEQIEVDKNENESEQKEKEIEEEVKEEKEEKEEIKPEPEKEEPIKEEPVKEEPQQEESEPEPETIKDDSKSKKSTHKEDQEKEVTININNNEPQGETKKTSAIHSKSSFLNDFFSGSRHENAKRIQSQIVEIQNNALEYTKMLISISHNFEKMKMGVSSPTNSLFNSIFSLLGYSYNSLVSKPNLFVFATQAWFLDLSLLIENKLKSENSENLKFSNILQMIKENEIRKGVTYEREALFLQNLGILSGNSLFSNSHSSIVMMIENNIGKNFLHGVSNVIQNDQYLDLIYDVDRRGFEEILLNYFTKAVEKTLNIEMQTEEEGYIEYQQIYEDLKRSKESSKITNEEFLAKVKESYQMNLLGKKIDAFEQSELQICTQTFFDYSQMRIGDVIYNLKLFIRNFSSVIFKTKRLISQSYRKYLRLVQKMQVGMINVIQGGYNRLSRDGEKVIHLTSNITNFTLRKTARLVKHSDLRVRQMKSWLDDSMKNLIENINNQIDRVLPEISGRIKTQINKALERTEVVAKFVIEKYHVGYNKYTQIKENSVEIISNYIDNTSSFVRRKLKNLEDLIIFEEDKESGVFKIFLKKDLLILNPERFSHLYEALSKIFSYSYSEISIRGEKINKYMIDKYRKFICADSNNKSEEKKAE